MNSCMGGVWPAWTEGGDMGQGRLVACLLVELLVKGTICILAFYYIGHTLSCQIIMNSEIIIIWPLSVCVCVCVYIYIHTHTHTTHIY